MPAIPSETLLTKKAGPLPVYAWGGLSLIAAYAYSKHKAGKAAAAPATAPVSAAAEPGSGTPYFVIENNQPGGIHNHSAPVTAPPVPPVTVTPPTKIPAPPVNVPPSPEPTGPPVAPVPAPVPAPAPNPAPSQGPPRPAPTPAPTPAPYSDPNLHYTSNGSLSLNDLVRNNPMTPRGAAGIIAATSPSEPSDTAKYLALHNYNAKLPPGTKWNIPRQGT